MLVVGLKCDAETGIDRRAVAARLREVSIVEPSGVCQAIACIESNDIEAAEIECRLRSGEHVLVAGEPCWEQADWERLQDAARSCGVQLMVLNPDRYLASRQLVRQQIDGPLGTAGLVRIHCWQPSSDDAAQPARECRRLPAALVRELDSVLWLVGRQPSLVFAVEAKWKDAEGQHGRSVQVHLGFDEAMALVDCEVSATLGTGYRSLSVIGSSGAAYIDDQRSAQLLLRGGPAQALNAAESRDRQVAAMIQEFADAIATGRDLSATSLARDHVFAVADAVRRSIATRQSVRIASSGDSGRTPA